MAIDICFDWVLKTPIFDGKKGLNRPPPHFIFGNHRKSNKIKHCVDFFLVVVVKIRVFFTYFNLVLMGGITDR